MKLNCYLCKFIIFRLLLIRRSHVVVLSSIDREVDLVSPLVTPLTYEGLVDEIIGIDNGRIKVDASLLGTDESNELAPSKSTAGKCIALLD